MTSIEVHQNIADLPFPLYHCLLKIVEVLPSIVKSVCPCRIHGPWRKLSNRQNIVSDAMGDFDNSIATKEGFHDLANPIFHSSKSVPIPFCQF